MITEQEYKEFEQEALTDLYKELDEIEAAKEYLHKIGPSINSHQIYLTLCFGLDELRWQIKKQITAWDE